MTNPTPLRPALTAIAAVMVLSTTPALAQEVAPPMVSLPQVAAPPAESAVASPPAPSVAAPEAVQTVQSVPAAPPLPPVDQATPRRAPREVSASAPRPATAVAREAPGAQKPASVARVAAPLAAASASVEQARLDATRASTVATGQRIARQIRAGQQAATPERAGAYADWMLLGGGLLLVAGGAAFALTRRRRGEAGSVPDAATIQAEPAGLAMVDMREDREVTTAGVYAPEASIAADMPDGSYQETLERMVAQRPSQANPFLTRRKRLRRADFLLRTGRAEWREADLAPVQPIAEEAALSRGSDRWGEMRFGTQRATRIHWSPARR